MGRYKSLVGNTVIFGICNFTSKLLVFVMLPFYTAVLTTDQFGTADLITTTVGLLQPILTLGIAEGCMRFALDKKYDQRQVFAIGWIVILLGFLLLLASSPLLKRVSGVGDYLIFFVFLYVSTVINTFLNLFCRGIQKVKIVGLAGVVSAFTVVLSNILLLFIFKFGVKGYLSSMIIAHIVASIVLFWGGGLSKYWFSKVDSKAFLDVLKYSIPLAPNRLSWWVNHSSNRFF